MKRGNIVRFKDHEGNPCGPYALVTKISGKNVTIHYLTVDEIATVSKDALHICNVSTVRVSDSKLVRCVRGTDSTVSHTITSLWLKALNNQPEIITLYCPESKQMWAKYMFVCEQIRMETKLREKCIEIRLGKLLI